MSLENANDVLMNRKMYNYMHNDNSLKTSSENLDANHIGVIMHPTHLSNISEFSAGNQVQDQALEVCCP